MSPFSNMEEKQMDPRMEIEIHATLHYKLYKMRILVRCVYNVHDWHGPHNVLAQTIYLLQLWYIVLIWDITPSMFICIQIQTFGK